MIDLSYAYFWVLAQVRFQRARVRNFRRDFPLYVRTIRLNPEWSHRIDSAPCTESEYPYREGTAIVVRVAGRFGISLGVMNNHCDTSHRAVNNRLIAALQSADGGQAYWDTPERREAAQADSELDVPLMRTNEAIETTERTSGGLPVEHFPDVLVDDEDI